jgi:hypothetical protein
MIYSGDVPNVRPMNPLIARWHEGWNYSTKKVTNAGEYRAQHSGNLFMP